MDGCEETDFFSSMRAALPEYVVNCFLAAGYDVPEVVASMNTSEEPGNSIDLIEKYIHDHHSEDPNCRFYPLSDAGKPFRFPPGHRIRIQNFVYEQKQKKIVDIRVCRKRKVASSDNVSSCKKGRDSTYSSESETETTIASTLEQLRVSISVGERMVMCDGHCREWYHVRCVDYTGNKKWYCTNCTHVA